MLRESVPECAPALSGVDSGIVGGAAVGVEGGVALGGAVGGGTAKPMDVGLGDLVEPMVGVAAGDGFGESDEEGGGVGSPRAFFLVFAPASGSTGG